MLKEKTLLLQLPGAVPVRLQRRPRTRHRISVSTRVGISLTMELRRNCGTSCGSHFCNGRDKWTARFSVPFSELQRAVLWSSDHRLDIAKRHLTLGPGSNCSGFGMHGPRLCTLLLCTYAVWHSKQYPDRRCASLRHLEGESRREQVNDTSDRDVSGRRKRRSQEEFPFDHWSMCWQTVNHCG